ncbi:HYC_CC_PP family protein [Yeosuana sp. AK3]
MKKAFHKIVSFCMALLVFISTLSFSIESHYCDDVLVDSSMFGRVESCGMEIQQDLDSHEHNFERKGCCEDETLSISGQQDLNFPSEKINFEQQQFIVSFIYTYLNLFEGLQEKKVTFDNYPPPLIVRHIYKLDETYLI